MSDRMTADDISPRSDGRLGRDWHAELSHQRTGRPTIHASSAQLMGRRGRISVLHQRGQVPVAAL